MSPALLQLQCSDHVISEVTGKAIIKKLYGNFYFNVPVSVLTMLSLTFTDRHK